MGAHDWAPLRAGRTGWILCRYCTGSHSYCEFMSPAVLSSPEDAALLWSSLTSASYNLSKMVPKPWWRVGLNRRALCAWALHWRLFSYLDHLWVAVLPISPPPPYKCWRLRAVLIYRQKGKDFEVSLLLCSLSFPATASWPDLQYQVCVFSHGVGLKSNHNAVSYLCAVHSAAVPMGMPCRTRSL